MLPLCSRQHFVLSDFAGSAQEDFSTDWEGGFVEAKRDITVMFVKLAYSNVCVFAEERQQDLSSDPAGRESLNSLDTAVREGRNALRDVFPLYANLPNSHTGRHHAQTADMYGVVKNRAGDTKELKHARYRKLARSVSGRSTEVEIMTLELAHEAVRAIAVGAVTSAALPSDVAQGMCSNPLIWRLLQSEPPAGLYSGLEGADLEPESAEAKTSSNENQYNSDSDDNWGFVSDSDSDSGAPTDAPALSLGPLTLDWELQRQTLVSLVGHKRARQHVVNTLDQDIEDDDVVSVPCFESIGVAHGHTVFAGPGQSYYETIPDSPVAQPLLVRVIRAFVVCGQPFAHVEWGQQGAMDELTGCFFYKFTEHRGQPTANIIPVSRLDLAAPPHIHTLPRGTMLRNRFIIY